MASGTADGAAGFRDAARPGAGEINASVVIRAPADRVCAALLAWERQHEWVPFTRVRLCSGDGGEGSELEAVTIVGPLVLRDRMRVVRVDRPYEIRVVHHGALLRGPGVLRCIPMHGDRTQVVWHEWFHLPNRAAHVAWPLLWPGARTGLRRALRRLARLVEAGQLP